jgi:hypothetical protein
MTVCLSELKFSFSLSLYYSLSKYSFNVLHHFKYKFTSILFRGTIFLDGVVRTNSSVLHILFLHNVNIHMIVTSLVSTHTTYWTLRFELMLFVVQNIMIETCVYFVHT